MTSFGQKQLLLCVDVFSPSSPKVCQLRRSGINVFSWKMFRLIFVYFSIKKCRFIRFFLLMDLFRVYKNNCEIEYPAILSKIRQFLDDISILWFLNLR